MGTLNFKNEGTKISEAIGALLSGCPGWDRHQLLAG